MLQQVSTVYFGAYKLAHDMALRAEKCLQYEFADDKQSFIQFGYWDSLKKGLLAGEKLAHDIRRMDAAYLDLNKREFELTKHVSLAALAPDELLKLRKSQTCTFALPEWLFDMDFPGHYRRRIKSVSLTIPCVTGPYTGVHAMLTLTNDSVRVRELGVLVSQHGAVPTKLIATSAGENDAGLFELNFNDERYLPFEGAGAISEWTLTLTSKSNLFDLNTISDVVLHVRYTAAFGAVVRPIPNQCGVLLDLKGDFPPEWQQHLEQAPVGGMRTLEFELTKDHLPFYAKEMAVTVDQTRLAVIDSEEGVVIPPSGGAALGTWQVELPASGIEGAVLAILLVWNN
jgi:hypothetical protein